MSPRTIRNLILIPVLLTLLGGAVSLGSRYYNDPVRKAQRELNTRGIAADMSSAVDAAIKNKLPVLVQLATVGVALEDSDASGTTPLIAAVKARSLGAIELLLGLSSVRGRIDAVDGEAEWTALAHALEARNYELARRLLDAGADPDVSLVNGMPLLVEALQMGDMKLFEFLIDAGADPDQTTHDGQSCLSLALDSQNGELLAQLIDAGANSSILSPRGEPLLIEQMRIGNHDLIAALLEAGADPDLATESGATSLMTAVQLEDRALVDLLLDRGAQPSLADQRDRRPLAEAVKGGDKVLVARLIEAGADLDDEALVHQAYNSSDLELLALMLEAGAPAEAKSKAGKSLLEIAVASGNLKAADLILENGASCEGMLWPSLRSGKDEVLKLVLKHGSDVREKAEDGSDPIGYALRHNRTPAVAILLSHGAESNVDHPDGGTWLAHLIVAGKGEMAMSLLDHGACFEDQKASDGHSLLAWAIANGESDVAARLVRDGVDVLAAEPSPGSKAFREKFGSRTFRYYLESDRGINPLMIAAAKQDHQAARALVTAGAKPSVYTKRKTLWPVNIAAWFGDVEMMRIMLGKTKSDRRKIVIDLSSQRATFYENDVERFSTRVSTGKKGFSTPPGHYVVTNKHRHWNSTIYGSSMPYFLRLSCGSFGLHQGYVPSYPASHGCIRVPAGNAKSMFAIAELGDEVVIQR